MRKVRVPGVPADFRVPRGWPTPTDRWVRENAFWQPSPGWTPYPGLKPAPEGWTFWTGNDVWRRTAPDMFRTADRWAAAARILGIVMGCVIIMTGALALAGIPLPWQWFGIPLFLAVVVCWAMADVTATRITTDAVARASVQAAGERDGRLVREYQQYLVSAT